MLRDFHNNCKPVRGISPTRVTDNTAQVSTTFDLVGFGGLEIIIATGTLADADATFTVLVEDSPDDSTYTAVDDVFLLGTEAGCSFVFSDDNKVLKIGYHGPQRYVRMTITPSANTGNADLSAIGLLVFPRKAPQTSQSN